MDMRTTIKLVLVALASAAILAAAVGSASSNRLSVSEQRVRITYNPLSFTTSTGQVVRCNVTYDGSFHERTIPKTRGLLIGYTSGVTLGSCNPAGSWRMDTTTLPWHETYEEFGGTLPNFTDETWSIARASFEIQSEIFGVRVLCRYTPARVKRRNIRETRGAITSQRIEEGSISSETAFCPSGRLSGTGTVLTPGGAAVSAFLI
jgi:hypothetical protein